MSQDTKESVRKGFSFWSICRVKVTETSSVAVKSDEIIEADCDFG